MAYRIPSDDIVARAIENCLVRTPRMRSQRELCGIVETELLCEDPRYRIGAERIRRIGISRGLMRVEISYAVTSRELGDRCPVCSGRLSSVMNRTLDGGTVELERTCGICGFSAKGDAARPARYRIVRRMRPWTQESASPCWRKRQKSSWRLQTSWAPPSGCPASSRDPETKPPSSGA